MFNEFLFSSVGTGRIRVISKSKIRNKIAIMKNWFENEARVGDIWLNPHSKFVILLHWGFCWCDILLNLKGRITVMMRDTIIAFRIRMY
jgi:hypothetical protein